jgi:hypothetical protein
VVDFYRNFGVDVLDPVAPLDAVFDERKRYWTGRYRANAQYDEDKKILYQLLASCFGSLKFRVSGNGSVSTVYDMVASKLCKSAFKFIAKRQKVILVEVPELSWTDIGLGKLDKFVRDAVDGTPDLKFTEVYDAIQTRADMLRQDVLKVVRLG